MFLAIYILSAVVAAGVGKIGWDRWFQRDEEWEDKKRAFAELSRQLKNLGLKRLPAALDDLAFEDWSDFIVQLYSFAELVQGDKQALFKEFDEVFFNVLAGKITDPAQLALIEARITEAKTKAAESTAPTQGAAAVAAAASAKAAA